MYPETRSSLLNVALVYACNHTLLLSIDVAGVSPAAFEDAKQRGMEAAARAEHRLCSTCHTEHVLARASGNAS